MTDSSRTEPLAERPTTQREDEGGVFEVYSARLLALIAETKAEARRLGESASAASAARQELRAASGQTAEQARHVVELTTALASRIAELESSLDRAADLAERLESAEARAAATIQTFAAREATLIALAAKLDAGPIMKAVSRAESLAARLLEMGRASDGAIQRLQRSLEGAIEFTDRLIERHESLGSATCARTDVGSGGPNGADPR
ncbi:MAG: hypothetical protein JNK58_09840 [Phycisphaerae bacterium]|nr:hypothetical protein [Phycisphaerae bacterium]